MTPKKLLGIAALGVAIIGAGTYASNWHNLDNGERAVARDFFGNTKVIYKAGPFFNFMGDVETYPDFMGLDFTTMPSREGVGGTISAEQLPPDDAVTDYTYAPSVKYNEGGIGWVKGTVQFALPEDPEKMLDLHKKFRTASNLQTTLMLRTTEEALQFTAGLMSSQEAYMTHRTQFRSYAKDQLDNGIYATKLVAKETMGADGKTKTEQLPEIIIGDNGKPVRADVSPIDNYGITLTQFTIKDWDFEQKTKDQIALKRDAENAVITSKARTAEAEQARLEAIALAARDKARAQGRAEVVKAREVVNAERKKELKIIEAESKVEQAQQLELQRQAELKATRLEAQSIEVSSKARAEANDRLIKSGGQLSAEQRTAIEVNKVWADAFARKAVPTYNIGDSDQAGSSMNASQQAMQTLSLKAMRDMVAQQAPTGK